MRGLVHGLTFSCSPWIMNGLGQGQLLVAGVADMLGCIKCIIHNSKVKARFCRLLVVNRFRNVFLFIFLPAIW